MTTPEPETNAVLVELVDADDSLGRPFLQRVRLAVNRLLKSDGIKCVQIRHRPKFDIVATDTAEACK